MSASRRLLAAALVTTAAFGLAACGPDDSSDQGAGGTTATATAAPATGGAASPTASPTAAPATGTAKPAPTGKPTDGGPEGFCTHEPLPAGQKWIYPVKGTSATALVYKDTKDACGVDDVNFEAVGAEKTAQFAPTVKGHLKSVVAAPKDVNAADLAKHINECIATPGNQKGSYPCSTGAYKVAIDASGKVIEMWERPSS
ncbi:hypothetical protein ACH4E7_02895 [Kitasatospora sp. NPDC018058]|uniref:hypothetical protein n=1 Tax=Kitasatospora sp. NPDC018058 TaxID=3364025 RepID=UPI0037C19415